MDQPLRHWLRDALLVGLGVGLGFTPTLLVTIQALDPGSSHPKVSQLLELAAAATLSGTVLAALLAVPTALVATALWARAHALALSMGPVVGALGGVSMFVAISLLLEPDHDLETRALVWIGLAGAGGIGPPWVAYLSVLARGRSGRPVALATPLWAMAVVALSIVFLWLRAQLGYR